MRLRNARDRFILALAPIGAWSAFTFLFAPASGPATPEGSGPSAALGDVDNVRRAFEKWTVAHERRGGDRNVVIGLGWSKAFSNEYTRASGKARLDLLGGSVSVEIRGLPEGVSEVWLVDNIDRPGDSCAPEPGDAFVRVGRLARDGDVARLEAQLGQDAFSRFDVDVVVVARDGKGPVTGGFLFGSPSLFQRLHRAAGRAGFAQARDASLALLSPPGRRFLGADSRLALGPMLLQTTTSPPSPVEVGRDLFFNETFNGNGRTCGSCHPAENNLTIDPTFISTLPANNALFVAEFTPALSQNFENPTLMRQVGLILENVDGFGDLANKFVMRGVPHTLALGTSIQGVPGAQGGDPADNTGWGGDGAPNAGTLRDFATGAVRQHFTKTLARIPASGLTVNTPPDFRFPTDAELDAMVAFQLSLGRQAEINLPAMSFKNAVVERGKRIFNNSGGSIGIPADPDPTVAAGKCFFCHKNAGAQDFVLEFLAGIVGKNANFNTGVERLPNQPADLIDPAHNPPDGGFGDDNPNNPDPSDGFGDNTFATAPLIEAADTGPFFHNNAIETIEEAVNFYNSTAFNTAPSVGPGIGGINLEPTEVVAVAAMLRVLNALENLNEALASEQKALAQSNLNKAQPHILAAREEVQDAIDVLRCGKLHPKAVGNLVSAAALLTQASNTSNNNTRNALINQAITQQNAAKSDMIF
ncbi:MAG TPA: hypothetical protein VFI25_17555 [Planctomycetota bacterium]|nr:hypothetical protein [Planctomycetota bacterium]